VRFSGAVGLTNGTEPFMTWRMKNIGLSARGHGYCKVPYADLAIWNLTASQIELSARGSQGSSRRRVYFAESPGQPSKTGASKSGVALYSKVLEFNPQNASAWTGQCASHRTGRISRSQLWPTTRWSDSRMSRSCCRQSRGPGERRRLAGCVVVLGCFNRGSRATRLTCGSRGGCVAWRAKNGG